MYDRTLKAKRDWHNMLDYAQKEAVEKGMEKRTVEIIQAMNENGIDIETIAVITKLSFSEIQKILNA